ncbi:alpha/beta fold hydrolase [Actinomadura sp. HBU206391]|uniref:alpha/beta fold hydrolase n=1 Tax=Actinomadura sp. HBU206391 TaxID=2731692 RepID=UPI00164FF8F3|nr:alpha/beta hydrolase [Actinomadura sp. HBU206391]MBC6459843.1 alpha/beta hydrolase [Actinomadura sp. HBU206391]
MSRRRTIFATALIGTGAASAGVAAQRRAVRRIQNRPDPHAAEPFGTVRGRPVTVRAADGTRLHAEIDDVESEGRSDLAVVFSHGWTLSLDSWHFQRRALRGLGRLVFWDQRGHGRSGGGHRSGNGLDQLGADLAAVIEQTVPADMPVVLIGHSMGGMTIMRYADRDPEAFRRRVVATGLVCTSSGTLGEATLGLPAVLAKLSQRAMPHALRTVGRGVPVLERLRHLARGGALLIEERIAFGPDASPAAIAFCEQMAADTRMDALIDFFGAMTGDPVISECETLNHAETLIIAGENDILTPPHHSVKIHTCVPSARLEMVPVAGHMAMLERPGVVSDHLGDLIERARKSLGEEARA